MRKRQVRRLARRLDDVDARRAATVVHGDGVAADLVLRAARLLALDRVDEHGGGADDGGLEDDRAAHVERGRGVWAGAEGALDCVGRCVCVRGAGEG